MRKTYLAGCQNFRQEAAILFMLTDQKIQFPLNQDTQWERSCHKKPLPLILKFLDHVTFSQIEVDFGGCQPVVAEHY